MFESLLCLCCAYGTGLMGGGTFLLGLPLGTNPGFGASGGLFAILPLLAIHSLDRFPFSPEGVGAWLWV